MQTEFKQMFKIRVPACKCIKYWETQVQKSKLFGVFELQKKIVMWVCESDG